jgi:hypothetical protein
MDSARPTGHAKHGDDADDGAPHALKALRCGQGCVAAEESAIEVNINDGLEAVGGQFSELGQTKFPAALFTQDVQRTEFFDRGLYWRL